MSFLSSKTPKLSACQSDVKVLTCLLETCFTGTYTGLGKTMSCSCCNISIETENVSSQQTSNVKLHPLHHGSITISLTDIRCPKLDRLLPYDCADDAVFCVSKQDTFTRDLLDVRVYDVCGMGRTFRDAFSSWMTKASMSSAPFHRIRIFPTLNRQRANEVLTSILMKLRFPGKVDMHRLFSCNKCEKELSNGERILDGVVMDGTAMRILGKLPEFDR